MPRTVTRDYRRTSLKPRHREVVRALAEAMFAEDGDVAPDRLDTFPEEVDKMISPASKTLRFGLLVMLDLISVLPMLTLFRASTFAQMSRADRVRFLDRLDRSRLPPLTLTLVAYKTLMSMLFYEDDEELATAGYPGPERHRYLLVAPAAAAARTGAGSLASERSS